MKRRARRIKLAAYLAAGAMLFQLGPCYTMLSSTGVAAFPLTKLLDQNQLLFGVFAVCGTPNLAVLDSNGVPVGPILNSGDDLVFFCPVSPLATTQGGG